MPFPGPIAPESNPPINPQYFQPSLFFITAISLGRTTTVTTSEDNNYVVGQLVRLVIPKAYGSYQLNERQGYVISIPAADQVTLDIDSKGVNTFISSPTGVTTLPQMMAIGDINSGVTNTGRTGNGTYVPGSFINISPL